MSQLTQDPRFALVIAQQQIDEHVRASALRRQAREARRRRRLTDDAAAAPRSRRLLPLVWTRLLAR